MSETKEDEEAKEKKTLSLGGKGTLSLKSGGSVAPPRRQNIAQGRGRTVAVEVRRKRTAPGGPPGPKPTEATDTSDLRNLTSEEREARIKALREAEEYARLKEQQASEQRADSQKDSTSPQEDAAQLQRQKELEELQRIQEEERLHKERDTRNAYRPDLPGRRGEISREDQEEEESYRSRMKKAPRAPRRGGDDSRRRGGKLTVTQVLNEDYARERGPSLAAQRRAREKARLLQEQEPAKKQSREVVVPETITVQELANRMAERAGDVVKALMNMGVMATINQPLDPDTAELLIAEFGHKIKRVTEADVEEGIEGVQDRPEDMQPRPPVVTIMGHVDHGKTSLLDALRSTDVVSGEAGGITQHIGAYQVTLDNDSKITFLDTPGHAAFTQMRARGADVTDIVILVVAANDSIMPQTVEAINHAKVAGVPIIVAINKIDLPDANPQKVKTDLLQHEIVVEDMGGEVLAIEVSALRKMGLDKLEEAILLQAEILELKANPNRPAAGAVVEARLEQGRGNVATVLIQSGTLKIGDIFVVGSEWGRVRAMTDDRGAPVERAIPGQPVEVIGLQGAPEAGDKLVVVEDENKARQITSYRQRKRRDAQALQIAGANTFENLLTQAREGKKKELAVLIKGDVHGSVEAIAGALKKIEEENQEISVRVLHAGVGGITESDVTLAKASNALIIGFNVRANAQARELAERDKAEIRYYNIIYNVIDDVKGLLSGLLSPAIREVYLGQAAIRQVFNITKVGKVAGCMVTKGVVKRGAGVRLLRDDVVIHEGKLKTLKRFKDEVKEVKEGTECGMAFENYDDIKEGDVIECYEIVEEARQVE